MHLPISPHDLILWLQSYPAELITLAVIITCGVAILFMMRFFGAAGLMVYSALAVVIANLQVQKAADYFLFSEPITLGEVLFSSVFIVTSILTEYYGKSQAQRTVWLSFSAMMLVTFFMLLTLGFKPASGFEPCHEAMCTLFIPTPALITASLIAYAVGQFNEIWIFAGLSKLTSGNWLWFRTFLATMMGAFLDSLIFGALAWIVFAPEPLPWKTVFYTFILGAFIIRVIVVCLGIPYVYLARYMARL